MKFRVIALAASVLLVGSIQSIDALAGTARKTTEKPEGLRWLPSQPSRYLRTAMPTDTALAAAARHRLLASASTAALATAASPAGQFLTRPYTTWHTITSVFDHCNPDYTTDGKVCEFDGSVGYRSNGVDPSFSLGYAQTYRGSDYLYYDGHNGWDYALSYENVLAAGDGTVNLAGSDSINPCFGQTIILNHASGYSTRYAHLSAIYVSPGQNVTRGQVIARSGNTGCSSGPHLHFGVYITSSWTAIDPWGWAGAAGADPWPSDPGNLWMTGTAQFPLPWAPTNAVAVAGDRSATVTWSAPGFDGGNTISTYTVTASPGGAVATVAGSAAQATVTGLADATPYTFTVTALNLVGSSAASAPSNSVIPIAVPGPPIGVHASPGIGSATVSWAPPASIGSSPITAYTVTVTPGGSTLNAGVQTTAEVSGLTNGTTYSFTVVATNAAGTGAASVASNKTTPLAVTTWVNVGGPLGSGPAAASPATQRLELFYRGPDGALWHRSFAGAAWAPAQRFGGIITADPAAVSSGPSRTDVFGRGQDNQLWHGWYDGTTWSGWEPLGGQLASAPRVSSWGPGRLDVFVRGVDSQLWHRAFDGGAWASWEPLGGIVTDETAAVSQASGRIDLFTRGQDGQLWHKWWGATGWSQWEPQAGILVSGPGASSWGPGRLDVFIRGQDNGLWHKWWDGSGWSQWEPLGGILTSGPSATSWGPGRIDVFGRGADQSLWQRSFD